MNCSVLEVLSAAQSQAANPSISDQLSVPDDCLLKISEACNNNLSHYYTCRAGLSSLESLLIESESDGVQISPVVACGYI